ncbi:signal peptidase II [Pelomicrobium sp.]|jgi:signal peptidase II|uniref:signal peptidase II n=1 Tax=Pelomicrobium sp. TaxID=2815319 RepID=UPI002FDE0B45
MREQQTRQQAGGRSYRTLALLVAGFVLIMDFLTKRWVEASLAPGAVVPVTPFFNLVLTFNRGAAFSFLADASGWQREFFIGIAVAASALILYLLQRYRGELLFCLALGLILGGALGNLWDRITLGHVVDFLDFHLAGYHWPAFNVADAAITCGALALLWDAFRGSRRQR